MSAGCQLLEVDHKEWQPGVTLAQYRGANRLVWAKFGDPESEEVRVTPAAAAAAQFYSELVRLRVAASSGDSRTSAWPLLCRTC